MPAPTPKTAVLLLVLCATACTTVITPGQPTETTLATPIGPIPLTPPVPTGIGGSDSLANPPGNALPIPTGRQGRDGTYAGYADVLTTAGGLCINDKPVSNFKVSGNQVRFGEWRGTIGPNGDLQMIFGNAWIAGRFQGPTFRGQLNSGDPAGCSFALELDRVGP
jgi:hypothetical protein